MYLSLPELEAILVAAREKEHRQNRFTAALKGIDLDKGRVDDAKEKFDEVQRRVEARLTGANEKQLEFDVFNIDVETDELE